MAPCPSTRRAHNLLKLCSEVAIRVPPAQSSTAGEQLASASSGSRCAQRPRHIGQPRAEQEHRDALARIGDGMQEMQEQAGVLAHRARDIEQRHDRRRLLDPPEAMDVDDVAAGAQGAAQRAAHVEPQAARDRAGSGGCAVRPAAAASARWRGVTSAISAALICAKSFFCRISLSETDSRRSCSWCLRRLRASRGCDIASCTRREAGRRLLLGLIRQRHRIQHVLPLFRGAEEQVEGLREDQRMLVALDEDRLQRGEDVGAVADVDHLQRVHGIDDRARPDRHAGRAQRAGKADDVVGHIAGRRRR